MESGKEMKAGIRKGGREGTGREEKWEGITEERDGTQYLDGDFVNNKSCSIFAHYEKNEPITDGVLPAVSGHLCSGADTA
jgi:hypothetical protein